MISEKIKNFFRGLINPIVDGFIKIGITPNIMTLTGFFLSLISGIFYGFGFLKTGALILIFSGICDTFDGMIARKKNVSSDLGAFFDSTMDRFNEFFVLSGLLVFYLAKNDIIFVNKAFMPFLIFCALFFSIMTSYVRARAEGLDIEMKRGLMTRAERVVFIIIISFLPLKIFNYMLILFTVLTFLTTIERIFVIIKKLRR